MKRLFYFTLILSIFASCGQKLGDNEFLVKGVLENSSGKMIFLSEYTQMGPQSIDSIEIEDNGEFKLIGRTSHPKFYMLKISPTDYITLLIDSANVLEVTADALNFASSYKVKGSKDMELVIQLNERLKQTHSKMDSLGQFYDLYFGKPEYDSIKMIIDKEFQAAYESQREFSKKFIDDNISSMACMLALSQQVTEKIGVFNVSSDFSIFEKVDSALYENYPQSVDVIKLHEFITLKKQQNATAPSGNKFKIGDKVPDISLNDPDGKTISLYSLRGKYVLLDFWAGWCRPCRMENPNLVQAYKNFKNKGFEIYQVSLDQKKEVWIDAIANDNLSAWKHVSDLKFWKSEAALAYEIQSIPANYLLDPNGKVIAVNLREAALEAKLKEIFK